MDLLGKLRALLHPVASDEEQEDADQVDFDHETDKTSALAAPPTLQGQKFWEP